MYVSIILIIISKTITGKLWFKRVIDLKKRSEQCWLFVNLIVADVSFVSN